VDFAYFNGDVAIVVQYWVEHYEEVDAGCRIDIRRAEAYPGSHHRPGAEGFRVLPVGDGGIYRIDLSVRVDSGDDEVRYHHHPTFVEGDVGPRVFDDHLSADPLGWIERRLRDLPGLLREKGRPELADSVDTAALDAAIPTVMSAVKAALHPSSRAVLVHAAGGGGD
jgi:hypothetical protein